MAAPTTTVIAFDIGGVIINQHNDEPIENSLESIIKLSENPSYVVIFISKCKDDHKQKSNIWLKNHKLSHIRTYYCLECEDKIKIAKDNKVDVMIDDRMQVLRTFPSSIIKIWFCPDSKKIEGAQKFQPEFINSVSVARSWKEIMELIEQIQA